MEGFEENTALQGLIKATGKQIALAHNPQQGDEDNLFIAIEEFEYYKPMQTGEALLIVEQLRLIAFTALDIQQLLQQVNFSNEKE
ncbi:hypothetical protein ACLKMH_12500 [Psychromonas sp. KJ10-10]|uniref:hypothetical protein n=1 Tax=Psychromonas sp. KJ10-10 TaxID=3391823 RepID=UPI0039B5C2AF